jgi:hypothetical protein
VNKLLFGGVAATVALCAALYGKYLHTAAQLRDALLYTDSLQAAADTTRLVYADSVRLFERRAIQQDQRADALDRDLGRERRARVALVAQVESLQTTATTTPTYRADTATANFIVTSPPYHAKVDVVVPPPPTPATLELAITLDPAPVEVRLGCGPASNGLRPATVLVAPPSWLDIDLTLVEQDPDVCQSPILLRPSGLLSVRIPAWVALLTTLAAFGLGLTVG